MIEQLRRLASNEMSFGEGEVVFAQGSKVSFVYLVVHGSVRLLRHQSDGAAIVMQRATAGSVLAEASLFSDRYHCDAVALLPSKLVSIRKTLLVDQIFDNPELARMWNAYMAREIQHARRSAEIISLRTGLHGMTVSFLPRANGRPLPKIWVPALKPFTGNSPNAKRSVQRSQSALNRSGTRPTR